MKTAIATSTDILILNKDINFKTAKKLAEQGMPHYILPKNKGIYFPNKFAVIEALADSK